MLNRVGDFFIWQQRIILTLIAVEMLKWPYLKIIGALLLLYIGISLLSEEDEGEEGGHEVGTMAAAIRTILIADLVMSLDNVIAVAAAAKGSTLLLIVGLGVSIPLVVFASTLLLTLMTRFPIIITLGAALLGWVSGEMAISDPAVKGWIDANMAFLHVVAAHWTSRDPAEYPFVHRIADQLRRFSLFQGVDPDPVAITAWSQPWVPLWFEWELTLALDERATAKSVAPDSAAAKAGFKPGDKIATFAIPANEQNFDRLTEELRRQA